MDNDGYIGMAKIRMQLIGFMEINKFQKQLLQRISMLINLHCMFGKGFSFDQQEIIKRILSIDHIFEVLERLLN